MLSHKELKRAYHFHLSAEGSYAKAEGIYSTLSKADDVKAQIKLSQQAHALYASAVTTYDKAISICEDFVKSHVNDSKQERNISIANLAILNYQFQQLVCVLSKIKNDPKITSAKYDSYIEYLNTAQKKLVDIQSKLEAMKVSFLSNEISAVSLAIKNYLEGFDAYINNIKSILQRPLAMPVLPKKIPHTQVAKKEEQTNDPEMARILAGIARMEKMSLAAKKSAATKKKKSLSQEALPLSIPAQVIKQTTMASEKEAKAKLAAEPLVTQVNTVAAGVVVVEKEVQRQTTLISPETLEKADTVRRSARKRCVRELYNPPVDQVKLRKRSKVQAQPRAEITAKKVGAQDVKETKAQQIQRELKQASGLYGSSAPSQKAVAGREWVTLFTNRLSKHPSHRVSEPPIQLVLPSKGKAKL